LTSGDVLIFAFALADSGSEEAEPFIERLRPTNASEAFALEALLRVRQEKYAEAIEPLLAAYAAFYSDPWPKAAVQTRTFQMAPVIAAEEPTAASRLFDALKSGPLPGYLMEDSRRMTLARLTLEMWKAGQPVAGEGFALLEPWPEWTRQSLTDRYRFYSKTGLGDVARARADLAEYLGAEGGAFNRGLEKPPEIAAGR
jgi:hypothetical protein